MDPKQKANEIYKSFHDKIDHQDNYWGVEEQVKEISLMHVDNIIEELSEWGEICMKSRLIFWREVRTELLK